MPPKKGSESIKKIIGLTGGAGSGKSSVAKFLGERNGIEIIDADEVCRFLVQPEEDGWIELKKILDEKYFIVGQDLNRVLLRQHIFADHELRQRIDKAIHPLVRRNIMDMIFENSRQGGNGVLVEVPLLFEAGWQGDFDEIVVVYSEKNVCLKRLSLRDNVTETQAMAMIDSQLPLKEKVAMADYVVDNSGPWSDTCRELVKLEKLLWGSCKSDQDITE